MVQILRPKGHDKIDIDGEITMPGFMVPSYRHSFFIERGVQNRTLLRTPDSIGDVVCCEPIIRYMCDEIGGDVYVHTRFPEFFEHLDLKHIYGPNEAEPDWTQFYTVRCYYDHNDGIHPEFIQNFNTQIIDYISTCVFKNQLPIKDRVINLPGMDSRAETFDVVVHPGRSWPSKTFPKAWWDSVIRLLVDAGAKVALIGAGTMVERGTVAVDPSKCTDLRSRLDMRETVGICQNARVILTNDSSPLHIAASSPGTAWIGFLSTVKHPDMVTHWRRDPAADKIEFGWRMQNLSLGWVYRPMDMDPVHCFDGRKFNDIDPAELNSYLPDPRSVAAWALSKLS